MSIIAYAIRTCLGAALTDSTLAEGRVFDSAVQPIDEMVKQGGAKPFIVISTDDEKITFPNKRWELLDASRTIAVVVEIAVGGMTQVELPQEQGGGEALRLDIPHTDEGLETSLNMIGRQVFRQIAVGGPWADLFKDIACWPDEATVTRGANAEQGTRYAARQYVFQVGTIPEPEFGIEPEPVMQRLLDLMAADPRFAGDVPLVKGMITGESLPEWRRRQADLGLTNVSYSALQLSPYFGRGDVAPPRQPQLEAPGRPVIIRGAAQP